MTIRERLARLGGRISNIAMAAAAAVKPDSSMFTIVTDGELGVGGVEEDHRRHGRHRVDEEVDRDVEARPAGRPAR